jgi:hypothetical protein
MIKSYKPKNFWFGLTIFGYSLFLFCQGIWMSIYYQYIFPEMYWIPPGYVPNYSWIFEKIGVLVPSIVGGFIFMIVGLYIISKRDKPKVFVGITILSYSFILILQTIWFLFIFPNFYPQLIWYVSTNIFVNYPIFFRMIGAIIPPIVGSIIFMVIGLIITKISLRKKQALSTISTVNEKNTI